MPVCKAHHAFTALNMHSIRSASEHKLLHIHHSVVYLKHLRIWQYNLPLWCSSLCICMNLYVIHKLTGGAFVQSEAGAKGRAHFKCILGQQVSLSKTTVPQGLHVQNDPFRESLRWLAGCAQCRWRVCTVVLKGVQLQCNLLMGQPQIQFVH